MVLELYVWGPAFGLPSIDAHCLAAIAYLQQAVPEGKWSLIISTDPAASPVNELPALKNGDIWIGGFRNIFHYVAQVSAGEWILDAGLPEQASADVIAFSSFVESHGQPLLDLSLYVSSQNYSMTRPIYSNIQPFPLPYLTPHAIRTKAKQRTSHLGLSLLDIDEDGNKKITEDSVIPESLRRPKNTVSSLLHASPETNAQIRLHALAASFSQPLQGLKGKKRFFVSDTQMSSLDCLALGYLCLMLVPDLPQPWLARTLRKEFPDLCSWVEDLRASTFGGAVSVGDILRMSEGHFDVGEPGRTRKRSLPWKTPLRGDISGTAGIFATSIISSIPGFGQFGENERIRQHGSMSQVSASPLSWPTTATLGSVIAGLGIAGYAITRNR